MASVAVPVSRPNNKIIKPDTTTIGLAILALMIVGLLVMYLSLLKPTGKTISSVPQQASVDQSTQPLVPGAGLPASEKDDDDDNY